MMQWQPYPSQILENHTDITEVNVEKYDHSKKRPSMKIQYLFEYGNGYEVSVITGFGAYGNEQAPYELGLMYKDGSMTSLEGVTDGEDVVSGYNTVTEILEKLAIVKAQPGSDNDDE